MAVAPTGDIYKALSFDNVSSRTYGVYITGSAVYNAPEREVEMISIPGRNGQFALDKGRFENIEVTYPAGIFADTEADFADAVSEFRNFLCSRKGYVRLQDEYNPNEYRMAIYKSGLEVDPAQLKAGEFEITFDCKPQRFLTSGDTAVTVSSGDTLTNPTLFESSPLLEVEGYGLIGFNGYEITLTNEEYGALELASAGSVNRNNIFQYFNDYASMIATGDTITQNGGFTFSSRIRIADNATITAVSASRTQTNIPEYAYNFTRDMESNIARIYFEYSGNGTMTFGTNHSEYTDKIKVTVSYTLSGDATVYSTIINYTINVGKYATSASCRFYVTESHTVQTGYASVGEPNITYGSLTCVSTASVLGHPTYIDCDLGEAYKIENDTFVSLNRYIDLGSKLPVLSVGNSVITFDNTFTSLKIVPNWWKV